MLKICKDKWDKNQSKLLQNLMERTDLNKCYYKTLVELTFESIMNEENDMNTYDISKITEIDDGDYQGTLIYLIPFAVYQPAEGEYLMTFINYGSCSACDTLQGIQKWSNDKLTECQLTDFMALCKDIITNTVKPYNSAWRNNEDYNQVEFE